MPVPPDHETPRSVLLLVSTPWQLFCALGLLFGPYRDARRTLALIDQRPGRENRWLDALAHLAEPGLRIVELPRIGKSVFDKVLRTRPVLRRVRKLVLECEPDEVVGGNDRRAEFQYAAQIAQKRFGARGVYLDDGSFSYSGLVSLRPRRAEALIQALEALGGWLCYGLWYRKPLALGLSNWSQSAWLAFPEHAHEGLSRKPRRALRAEWYRTPQLRSISERLIRTIGDGEPPARAIDELLLLPHDHLLRVDRPLRSALSQRLSEARAAGRRVAVKRHPRSREWLLDAPRDELIEWDPRLPIEAYAPWLQQAHVIGSLSTALLSLRWLCPAARIESIEHQGALRDPLRALYPRLGILGRSETLHRIASLWADSQRWVLVG
ncbi:hypothetical protein [Hydrocarboniphaga effusa]|uniref:hypothetical protein n=1 Tax=Hydrocarboniphaga effusa TaxID=243629 RepID=UPI0031379FB0